MLEATGDNGESLAEPLPATPNKSPPSKVRATESESANAEVLNAIFEKLSIIEKTTETTSKSMESLSATVQQLLNQVSVHSEKLNGLEIEIKELKQKNSQLQRNLEDIQRYGRKWNLKVLGLREKEGEDLRSVVIDIFGKMAPMIREKLPVAVDVVHRLGKIRQDGSPRTTIARFTMRLYRDIIWKAAKNSGFLADNKLRIKEALTPEEVEARQKLWPLVKKAREEGKKASFNGPFAFIDGKKIDFQDVK